ncbi:phage portal protein [Parabacteroides goldsteinii]|uniref:phage portal protein n=1 Tax=Parabacteroides goldsteinii TaxID=328812 RepID=UPI0025B08C31|nr:phage portal protein [Parabacteroides goldsteinii]
MNYFESLLQLFQNKILNSLGVERDLIQLIKDKDISRAIDLMQCRDEDVDTAIKEYDPALHEVNRRDNKPRAGQSPYITEKLSRSRQRYINEVELFFLLGQPITWEATSENTDDAFQAYNDFINSTRFNTTMRQAKRLAGAETECAKVYHIYQDEGKPQVKVKVISRSNGYILRPLFDQWDNLIAFGYGYALLENGKSVDHFDIETPDFIYRCKKQNIGWEVAPIVNPSGKINVIYYRQNKAWDGVQNRINREEFADSKAADSVNYYSDPKLLATADVLELSKGGETNNVGEVIKLANKESSMVEYLVPPEYSTMKEAEKKDLSASILFDTFTPDFSYENMKGLGTLSGEALKRALSLGYIKRDNLKEIYDILVDREKNLILAIMMNVTHIGLREQLSRLKVKHKFSEPFAEDREKNTDMIIRLYSARLISLQTAVNMLSFTDKPKEEIVQILREKQQNQNNNESNKEDNQSGQNNTSAGQGNQRANRGENNA